MRWTGSGFTARWSTWATATGCTRWSARSTGTSASVLVNGFKSLPFPVRRGVKQGDPAAPLLYLLALQPLLVRLKTDGSLTPFPLPGGEKLSVAAFADDCTLFVGAAADGTVDARPVLEIVHAWFRATGGSLRMDKCWGLALGGTTAGQAQTQAAVSSSSQELGLVKWVADGRTERLLGFALGNGLGEDVMVDFFSAVVRGAESVSKSWSRRVLCCR